MHLDKETVRAIFENLVSVKHIGTVPIPFDPMAVERADTFNPASNNPFESGEFVCPSHPVLREGTDAQLRELLANVRIEEYHAWIDRAKATQDYESCAFVQHVINQYYRVFPA